MIIKDWIQKVEDELTSGGGPLTSDEAEEAVKAIQKHCPFKQDVAYIMVPRCESCAHWTDQHTEPRFGICDAISPGNGQNFIVSLYNFGCVEWKAR